MPSGKGKSRLSVVQLLEALGRIGRSEAARATWLVQFSNVDLNEASEDDREQWAEEVAAFVFDTSGSRYRAWTDTEVCDAQRWARERIEELVTTGTVNMQLERPYLTLTASKEPHGLPHVTAKKITAAHGQEAFKAALYLLLTQLPQWIRRCVHCQDLFLTTRTDQRFCTTRCTSLYTTRQWREGLKAAKKKKEEARKARAQKARAGRAKQRRDRHVKATV